MAAADQVLQQLSDELGNARAQIVRISTEMDNLRAQATQHLLVETLRLLDVVADWSLLLALELVAQELCAKVPRALR